MITPEKIVEIVAKRFHITPKDMRGKSRMRHICTARWVACEHIMVYAGWSKLAAGRFLNRKSHGSVMLGLRGLQSTIQVYPALGEAYTDILNELEKLKQQKERINT